MQRFDLNFVAHADDDTLFQQPDIINSLIAGVGQTTVYLTCGNDTRWNDLVYLRRREQGAMDAYVEMCLIQSSQIGTNPGAVRWNVRQTNDYAPLSATVAECAEYPNLHLIFIRLSACSYTGARWTQDFEMRTVPPVNDLEDLWVGNCSSLTAVDNSGIYDKDTLMQGLLTILNRWRPRVIRTLDPTVSPTTSGDHPDHYYSALFAQEAIRRYLSGSPSDVPEYWSYRGYNITSEQPNLNNCESMMKQWLFYYYSYNDSQMAQPGTFNPSAVPPQPNWLQTNYPPWLQREYGTKMDTVRLLASCGKQELELERCDH